MPSHQNASRNVRSPQAPLVSPVPRHELAMFCWGSTVNGELGLGGIEEELILAPQELKFGLASEIAQVACGIHHTIVVTTSGKAYSCGSNDQGQLGHSKSNKTFQSIEAVDSFVIIRAACGLHSSILLDEWGRVFCWGSDTCGQLGIANARQSLDKPKIVRGLAMNAGKVVQIAAGDAHCLALVNNGELYAWGSNDHGQLGLGSTADLVDVPTHLQCLLGLPIAHIACGSSHCFIVSKSGSVYGWGKNSYGQLGLNDNVDRRFPCQLKTLRTIKVKYIACGGDFTVFLTKDGGVFTCGAGMYGQLGHGAVSNEFVPRKVLELMGSTVTQVACGRHHTLAFVPSRGRVYAFGLGGSGQLGIRVARNSTTPQMVLGPWVSPSGVCIISDLPSGSTTLNSVSAIYAGGNQCFTSTSCFLDNVPSVDHRCYPARSQVLTITVDKMRECLAVGEGQSINMDLLEYLELVFNSQYCINASLLLPDDEHHGCTSRNHGIDIPLAETCFEAFRAVVNNSIRELVLNIMIGVIMTLPPSPPDVETLRFYLLAPLYHEFENVRHWEALQNPFGLSLTRLKAEALTILNLWWGISPSEYFERLIRIYKNVFLHILTQTTLEAKATDGVHPTMLISLEILDKLNKCNKALDDPKVSYDSFYIPELTEHVDVRTDYVKWVYQRDPMYPNKVWFCNYSFLFDTQGKTMLLETDQSIQMRSAMNNAATRAMTTMIFDPAVGATITAFLELTVSRETIVQDTIRELTTLDTSDLKKPLKVKIIGEEAEDAGGVRKEFFMLLMCEILDPKYGMFRQYEETRTVWFSEDTLEDGGMYYLIGLLCGLAIYNFTIINLPFPLVLYKKLLKERVSLQDVKGLSPTLAKGFQDLLDYEDADLEQVFSLTFEITREAYGEIKTIPLKPDGGNIPVTQENKAEFVRLYVDMMLNVAVESQFVSFDRGFHKVCGGRSLDLFHSHELMALVVGNENYDWMELERITEYKNGYSASDRTIKLFWQVFHELTLEEKKKFLLFLTGSDRIPIQGMKAIRITIQPTNDEKYLPVAHTCFNLLDLPHYRTKEKLRYKLLQAIQQTHGFSLV